jgi:hypothetical protein
MSGFKKCVALLLGCIVLAGCLFTVSLLALQKENRRRELIQKQAVYDYNMELYSKSVAIQFELDEKYNELMSDVLDPITGEIRDDLSLATRYRVEEAMAIKEENEKLDKDWRKRLEKMEQELVDLK